MGAAKRTSAMTSIETGTANAWDDAYEIWLANREPGALQMPRTKARRSDPRLEVIAVPPARNEGLDAEALQMPREILF